MINITYYTVCARENGKNFNEKNFKTKKNAINYFKDICNNNPNNPRIRDRKTDKEIAITDFNNYTAEKIIDKVYVRAYNYYYIETATIEFED